LKGNKILNTKLINLKLLSKIYDDSIISLNFKNGINSTISVSWTSPYKERRFIVTGTKGILILDDTLSYDKKLKSIFFEFIKENNFVSPGIIKEDYINVKPSEPLELEIHESLKFFDGKIKKIFNNFNESKKILELIFKMNEK